MPVDFPGAVREVRWLKSGLCGCCSRSDTWKCNMPQLPLPLPYLTVVVGIFFLSTQVELDAAIKSLSVVAAAPELYPALVDAGAVTSLLGLLTHENTVSVRHCCLPYCCNPSFFHFLFEPPFVHAHSHAHCVCLPHGRLTGRCCRFFFCLAKRVHGRWRMFLRRLGIVTVHCAGR